MPYQRLPAIMTSDLVRDVVAWFNQFPSRNSVISTVGMRQLMTGVQFDYRIHCRVEFGQYCQVHEDKDRKNRVDVERTTGAIALKHSGNLQGGYRFLSLETGRVLVRQHFTVCPITTQVIDQVHQLADRDRAYHQEDEFQDQNDPDLKTEDDQEREENKEEIKLKTGGKGGKSYEIRK